MLGFDDNQWFARLVRRTWRRWCQCCWCCWCWVYSSIHHTLSSVKAAPDATNWPEKPVMMETFASKWDTKLEVRLRFTVVMVKGAMSWWHYHAIHVVLSITINIIIIIDHPRSRVVTFLVSCVCICVCLYQSINLRLLAAWQNASQQCTKVIHIAIVQELSV